MHRNEMMGDKDKPGLFQQDDRSVEERSVDHSVEESEEGDAIMADTSETRLGPPGPPHGIVINGASLVSVLHTLYTPLSAYSNRS